MSVLLPVAVLADLCNPFQATPWGVLVSEEDVAQALDEGRLVSYPGTTDHAGRIAWLVVHEANDPITVVIDVVAIEDRMFRLLDDYGRWPLPDGNHRLAAAIYAQRERILGNVNGDLEHASTMFGVDCGEDEFAGVCERVDRERS